MEISVTREEKVAGITVIVVTTTNPVVLQYLDEFKRAGAVVESTSRERQTIPGPSFLVKTADPTITTFIVELICDEPDTESEWPTMKVAKPFEGIPLGNLAHLDSLLASADSHRPNHRT